MHPEESGTQQAYGSLDVIAGWQATLFIGALTVILGLIVTFHPAGSLNVVAVLLGILVIISGIFHLVRVFGSDETHRVWLSIVGLALIVIGVVLIRHLDLTLKLTALFIGITWIVQGVFALLAGLAGGPREGRGWWIFFGIVSTVAGIVVASAPLDSLTVLAVLIGIWFIVMGLIQIAGAVMLRRAASDQRAAGSRTTGPRSAGEGAAAL